jgi:hypothetical protein
MRPVLALAKQPMGPRQQAPSVRCSGDYPVLVPARVAVLPAWIVARVRVNA